MVTARALTAEARQAWHDRHLTPLAAPAATAACVWSTTGLRGWPLLPVAALLVHTLTGLERGRAVLRPAPAARRAHRARAGRTWLALALTLTALTPHAWPFLPLAALELTALTLTTRTARARLRLRHRLRTEVAAAVHTTPTELHLTRLHWQERRCTAGTLRYPPALAASADTKQAALTAALRWQLQPPADADLTFRFLPAARAVTWTTAPGLPTRVPDRPWPPDLPGVVAGITTTPHATTVLPVRDTDGTVHRLPLLCWDPTAHLLVAGITRSGKTQLLRGMIYRGIAAGAYPGGAWIIDGKSGGDFLPFAHREHIHTVANAPAEWRAALDAAHTEMHRRYTLISAWKAGDAPEPDLPRALLVIDEVQQVSAEVGTKLVEQVARLALAANVTMIIATQRPDTSSAIPGAARDNIADRIICGPLSEQGARMMLPEDWRDAVTLPRIPGRCLAHLNGRLVTFQAPYAPTPVEAPDAEHLYPPRVPVVTVVEPEPEPATEPATEPAASAPAAPAAPIPPTTPRPRRRITQ